MQSCASVKAAVKTFKQLLCTDIYIYIARPIQELPTTAPCHQESYEGEYHTCRQNKREHGLSDLQTQSYNLAPNLRATESRNHNLDPTPKSPKPSTQAIKPCQLGAANGTPRTRGLRPVETNASGPKLNHAEPTLWKLPRLESRNVRQFILGTHGLSVQVVKPDILQALNNRIPTRLSCQRGLIRV